MALVPIKNQPIRMESFPEETFMCSTDQYCVHYLKDTDDIIVQMKQTPCGDDLVDDGTFTEDNYLPYWAFAYGYWEINDNGTEEAGSATKIPGSSGTLTQDVLTSSNVVVNDYLKLTYTVTGMTAGQLTVLLGGNTSRVVTENGTYTDYVLMIVVSDMLLSFSANSTFDGSVSEVSCYLLKHNFDGAAILQDLDGNLVASPTLTDYADDRVIFTWNTDSIDEGCYRVAIVDECDPLFTGVTNVELNLDVPIDDSPPGGWLLGGSGATGAISGGFWSQTTVATAAQNLNRAGRGFAAAIADGTYVFKVEIITGSQDTDRSDSTLEVWLCDGFYTTGSSNLVTITNPQPNLTYTLYVIAAKVTSDVGFLIIQDNRGSSTAGQVNQVASVSIKYGDVLSVTNIYGYESNCLKVKTDLDDMALFRGQTIEDTNSVDEYSMGFYFITPFNHLQIRVPASFTNPHRPIKQDAYLYSTGSKKKTFAQLDKAWDLVIHAVDENAHDVISTILNMEYCYINGNRYICEDKDYSADWAKGEASVAEAVVEVSRVGDVIFK